MHHALVELIALFFALARPALLSLTTLALALPLALSITVLPAGATGALSWPSSLFAWHQTSN